MKKAKIMFLTSVLTTSGGERMALRLAEGLSQEGYQVSVCCLRALAPFQQELQNKGIETYVLGAKGYVSPTLLLAILKLCLLLQRKRPHILHTHFFSDGLIGRLLGRAMGVPVIFSTIHNTHAEKGRLQQCLDGFTARFADKILPVSNAVLRFAAKIKGISHRRMEVIRPGIDLRRFRSLEDFPRNEFREQLGLASDGPVVASVCHLRKQKGHKYLLEAIPMVLRHFPCAQFLFVGDGPLRGMLEKQAIDQGIKNNVVFAGQREDTEKILQIANVFVLPSLFEGIPMSVVEASASATPVVATAIDGTPEAVIEGVTGLLVPPKAPQELAHAIVKLLGDKDLSQTMGRDGAAWAARAFDNDRMVNEYDTLYRRLLRAKGFFREARRSS